MLSARKNGSKIGPTFYSILLFLVSVLGNEWVYCQNYLKGEIKTVDSLLYIANRTKDSIPEQAKLLSTTAYNISKKHGYWKGEVSSLIISGICDVFDKKFTDGLKKLYNALEISQENNDLAGISYSADKLTSLYIDLGNLELAEKYCQICMNNGIKIKDTVRISNSFSYLSDIQLKKHDFDKALYFLYLALSNTSAVIKDQMESKIYKKMGIVFLEKKLFNQAKYYFNKAILVYNTSTSDQDLGSLYTLLGYTYQNQLNFSKSFFYYYLALSDRKAMGRTQHIVSSLLNLGKLHLDKNNFDSSYFYLNSGLKLMSQNGTNSFFHQHGLFLLYQWYEKQGMWKDALKMHVQYAKAKERYDYEKNRDDLLMLEANKYQKEIEQRNQLLSYQNDVQQLQLKNDRYVIAFYLFIILMALLLVLFVAWMYIRTRRDKKRLEAANKQLDLEILSRQKTENDLRIREEMYRFLADHSPDLIVQMDSQNGLLYISPNCESILGYSAQELNQTFTPGLIIHPEFQEFMKGLFQDMMSSRKPTTFTFEAVRKDGTKFWAESLSNPIFQPDTNTHVSTLSVIRNIEERIQYQEQLGENVRQKEIMLREFHHRVKNNFAILSGVVSLYKFQPENQELVTLVNDLLSRIRSMSLMHEMLYKNDDLNFIHFDIYIHELANNVAHAFQDRQACIIHDTESCILSVRLALPLGMVINELLTNSFKYAFHNGEECIIHIGLHPLGDAGQEQPPKWKLTIRDNGAGLPDDYAGGQKETLGSSITTMLVEQIGGSLRFRNSDGACFEILFNQHLD